MTNPSLRNLKRISASLDGQLSRVEAARLASLLAADPGLAGLRDDLEHVRSLLRRLPMRRAPHNFTLHPGMARLRPPLPRLAPVLGYASALAALLLVFTFGGRFFIPLAAAPAAYDLTAAEPAAGEAFAEDPVQEAGGLDNAAPAAPQATPVAEDASPERSIPTATPEAVMALQAPPPSVGVEEKSLEPAPVLSPWQAGLLSASIALAAAAALLRLVNILAFRARHRRK